MKYYIYKRLCLLTLCLFSIIGCSIVKEIPVQTIEKIEYRDSLVFIKDTVEIEIEKQIVKEVLPQIDTSVLQTDLAESIAYLDTTKRQIHHTLEQRGKVRYIIDTIYKVEYIDRIIERDKIVEVEIEKKYTPDWAWYSLIFNIVVVLLVVFCLYVKFFKK